MAQGNGEGPILFAYDGSEQAQAAIEEAARQLAPGRDAIVLTVWQPLEVPAFGGPPDGDAPELGEGVEAEARQTAAEGASYATSLGFHARPLTAEGSPVWRAIVASADDTHASIVVMGSHGRTGLRLALMGSVAAAVARHTDVPVMIVHAHCG